MGRLILVPVILAGLAVAGCETFRQSESQRLGQAHDLYTRGSYIKAYREYKPLADQGHPAAQFAIGYMYEHGQVRGILGYFGRTPDYDEAGKWYRMAASQGFAKAQLNLGHMYAVGHGVARDYEEAARWYRKAAIQGFAEAQYNLGVRYYEGSGVTRNNVLAHMWASLAVANSTGKTQEIAANLRDAVASRMTPKEISKAQQLAREWRQ